MILNKILTNVMEIFSSFLIHKSVEPNIAGIRAFVHIQFLGTDIKGLKSMPNYLHYRSNYKHNAKINWNLKHHISVN